MDGGNMTTKKFSSRLKDYFQYFDEFATDTIPMEKLKKDAKEQGIDDLIYVAGEDSDDVFMLLIKKI